MKNKIGMLLLALLCVSCGSTAIDYDLNGHDKDGLLKSAGKGLTVVKETEDYKILYTSINIVRNQGYDPATLTIFNKSKKIIAYVKSRSISYTMKATRKAASIPEGKLF